MKKSEFKQLIKESVREVLVTEGFLSTYGGVNVFEGTSPMRKGGSTDTSAASSSALGDVDPSDPGVDISGILGSSDTWKQMIK
jgi:hypothetical protein